MMQIFSKIKISDALLIFIGLVLAASFGIIVFGIFHGFDWTDEAWLFSTITSGRDSMEAPWGYQFLLGPLAQLVGGKIIFMRLLRLFFTIALAMISAAIIVSISQARGHRLAGKQKLFLYLISQIGTLLLWSWPARNLGYNEIASIVVQVVVLLLVYLLLVGAKNQTAKFVVPIILGLFLGLLWYAKFTSVVLLFPLAFFVILWVRKSNWLTSAVLFLTGFAGGILFPMSYGANVQNYFSKIVETILSEEMRSANAHSGNLVQMYSQDILNNVTAIFPFIVLLIIAVAFSYNTFNEHRWGIGAGAIISTLLFLWLGYLTYQYLQAVPSGAEKTGRLTIVIGVVSLVLLFFFARNPLRSEMGLAKFSFSPKITTAIVLIVIAPLVVSAGTNNAPSVHLAYGSTTWAAVMGFALLISTSIYSKVSPRLIYIPYLIGLLISIFALMLVVNDSQNPYRSFAFQKNNQSISGSSAFDGLNVTPEEAQWANWLKSQAEVMAASDVPTISLKLPGALLLFNNSDYANPWLDEFWPASYWSIEKKCLSGKPSDLIVLEPGTVSENTQDITLLNSSLEKCNLTFPNDFSLTSSYESSNPNLQMRIWRLNQ